MPSLTCTYTFQSLELQFDRGELIVRYSSNVLNGKAGLVAVASSVTEKQCLAMGLADIPTPRFIY